VKAICVSDDRALGLRDIPTPADAPPGYLLVDIEAAAINHGGKTFLATLWRPAIRLYEVWGASASGIVVAVGASELDVRRSRKTPSLACWLDRADCPA
jgi:NADPH2:quinone reductase